MPVTLLYKENIEKNCTLEKGGFDMGKWRKTHQLWQKQHKGYNEFNNGMPDPGISEIAQQYEKIWNLPVFTSVLTKRNQ